MTRFLRPRPSLFYVPLLAGVLGLGAFFDHAMNAGPPQASPAVLAARSDFARVEASPAVRHVALWAIDSGDHLGLPFLVVDKARAQVFAFDGAGRLRATAPALLGAFHGDGAQVPSTPTGRFLRGGGEAELSWLNASALLKLRGLHDDTAPGRGAQRLASEQPEDRRISDGSLHVADAFLQDELGPVLLRGPSIAYVLPETRSPQEVFGSYDVDGRSRQMAQGPAARAFALFRRPT